VDDDEAAYRRFIQDHGINFLTSRDPSKKSAQDYGTVMYPETYIIDRKGKIARKVIGARNGIPPRWLLISTAAGAKLSGCFLLLTRYRPI